MKLLLSSVEGNRQRLDGGAMFGNAPRMVWQKWLTPDEQHRIELACRSLLIETEDHKILCETGIGAFFEPTLAERYGVQSPDEHQLLNNLARLGIAQEEITHVVLSHLHFDHAGGLLPRYADLQKGTGELNFPNAHYVVSEGAWQRAKSPHPRDRASFIPGLCQQLEESQRLYLVPKGAQSLPFAKDFTSLFYSSGHTPEQMHLLVRGEGGQVFFCGDLVPGIAWLHTPITMGYDRFPELVIDEKSTLSAQAIREEWLLFFTHDPHYCAARCRHAAHTHKVEAWDTQSVMTRVPL